MQNFSRRAVGIGRDAPGPGFCGIVFYQNPPLSQIAVIAASSDVALLEVLVLQLRQQSPQAHAGSCVLFIFGLTMPMSLCPTATLESVVREVVEASTYNLTIRSKIEHSVLDFTHGGGHQGM